MIFKWIICMEYVWFMFNAPQSSHEFPVHINISMHIYKFLYDDFPTSFCMTFQYLNYDKLPCICIYIYLYVCLLKWLEHHNEFHNLQTHTIHKRAKRLFYAQLYHLKLMCVCVCLFVFRWYGIWYCLVNNARQHECNSILRLVYFVDFPIVFQLTQSIWKTEHQIVQLTVYIWNKLLFYRIFQAIRIISLSIQPSTDEQKKNQESRGKTKEDLFLKNALTKHIQKQFYARYPLTDSEFEMQMTTCVCVCVMYILSICAQNAPTLSR